MRALALVAVSCAAACGPPPAATVPDTTPMVATPAPEPPPAPRAPGPFRVGDVALRDRPDAVRVEKLVSGGLAARFGHGDSILVLRGRGGTLLLPGGRGGKLPARHFVRARFAPDDRHVVVVDEK
ncbi:MAG TPA: hypothetical protein VML75_22955, partial [Kofleriaceae bacterium]|nr:hypothetical protein [Kofleriaceae bacterium]